MNHSIPRSFARFFVTGCLLLCAAFLSGKDNDPGRSDEDLLAELQAIDDLGELEGIEEFDALIKDLGVDLDLPTWDFSGGIEAGFGYSDNVELAAFFPKSSSFIQGGADLMLWRYPRNGVEWTGYLDTSYTNYFQHDVEDASFALAGAEVKWKPRDTTTYAGALRYLYQNEVIDASSLDQSALGTTHAELSSFSFEPRARWDFSPQWTAEVSFVARYDDYRPPLDDLADYEVGLTLERATEHLGLFSLAYSRLYRDYMDRQQAAPGGTPLPDTHLAVNQDTLELQHTIRGGERIEWKVRTRLESMQSRDNGSGWYDYNRQYGRIALSLQQERWRLETDLAFRDYKYLQQRAGFGNPPLRIRREWSASARLERSLFENLVVFLEAELINSQSNDPFLEYDQVRGALGLRWFR